MLRVKKIYWDLTASSYLAKYLRISSYTCITKPLLIYDFGTDPIWISLYFKKIFFLFYQWTFKRKF